MKKFLTHIVVFLILMILCDTGFGLCMDYLNSHAKGGGPAKRNYVVNESNEDILMFGSSRMAHHYNPDIIQDSLGMTCYNCGEDGNGIIFCYGMLQMILDRYAPKMIIYDVSSFDTATDDYSKYFLFLKPYVGKNAGVRSLISSISPNEQWKLYSNFYRYNSICISTLGSVLGKSIYRGGYNPLRGEMNYEPKPFIEGESNEPYASLDAIKEQYLRLFIETCLSKGIKLIFAESPYYQGGFMAPSFPLVQNLCKEYDIAYIDCVDLPSVAGHKEFFKDSSHLNEKGADVYTRYFVSQLKRK
jgi:hypothetical protein